MGKNCYSTALDLFDSETKNKISETDFVFLDLSQNIKKDDIEILIGECKTNQTITKKQIDGLLKIKSAIEESGIKCHLLFSKTSKNFTKGELNHFKKLVKLGINPILFTSNELEPWYNIYKNYEQKINNFKLPFKRPSTFDELACNSVYIYELNK